MATYPKGNASEEVAIKKTTTVDEAFIVVESKTVKQKVDVDSVSST